MICTGSYDNNTKCLDGISISSNDISNNTYENLVPKGSWYSDWKISKDYYEPIEALMIFVEKYYENVLLELDPKKVFKDLDGKILLTEEEPIYFSHRHIVAAWLEITLNVFVPEVKAGPNSITMLDHPDYIKDLLIQAISARKYKNKRLVK